MPKPSLAEGLKEANKDKIAMMRMLNEKKQELNKRRQLIS